MILIATLAALTLGSSRAGGHADFGVDPSCGNSCSAAISAAIASCSAYDTCTVTLAPGNYSLITTPYGEQITFSGLSNVLITGPGATLVQSDISTVFAFNNCNNITLADFTIDMLRQPYTYGIVTASSSTVATVTFDETAYPYAGVTATYPWLLHAQGVLSFDPVHMRPAKNAIDIYALTNPLPISYNSATPGVLQLTVGSSIPVGTWLIIRHQTYVYNAFSAAGVTALTVRNVTLFSTAGMGVFTSGATGVTLQGFRVVRAPGRPMSITADGAHFSSCRGGDVLLADCVFEGQGDDALNVPSLYQDVEALNGAALQLGKDGTLQTPIGVAGDTVELFNRSSFASYGVRTIASMADGTMTLTSPPPPSLAKYDLVLNTAATPRSVTLLNNVFRNNRARGTLLKATNVYVSGNVYDHNSGPAAQAIPDGCYWFEGRTVANWTFVNNTIIGANYGPAMLPGDIYLSSCAPTWSGGKPSTSGNPVTWAQLHFDVTIANNTFITEQGEPVVSLTGVQGVVITGNNVTYAAGGLPAADFVGDACTQTTVSGNVCARPGGCVALNN